MSKTTKEEFNEVGKSNSKVEEHTDHRNVEATSETAQSQTVKNKNLLHKIKSADRRLLAATVMLFIVLIAGALWFFLLRPGAGSRFDTDTHSLTVSQSLGSVKEAKTIGNNKSIEIVDSRSLTSTINFSDKSFSTKTKVTAQEIKSLSNLPAGWQLVSGVNLTPSGTTLDQPATIIIDLPSGLNTSKIIGFEYDGDGKNFRIVPVSIKDNVASLKIDSFSGHGIINVGDSRQVPPAPDGIEDQAKQDIAAIIWLMSLQQAFGSEEGLTDKQLSGINDILTDWYKEGVEPHLKAAEGKSSKEVDEAAHSYVAWLSVVQAFGLEDKQQSRITLGEDLTALNLKKAVDLAGSKCQSDHDLEQVAFILRWYALGELMNLDGKSGFSTSKTKSLAAKCANFELTFKSSIHSVNKNDTRAYDDTQAEGKLTISTDENLEFKGTGKVRETNYSVDGKKCTPNKTLEYDALIEDGLVTASESHQSTSLLFTLKELDLTDFEYTCPITEDGILTSGGSDFWNVGFSNLHDSETVSIDADSVTYLFDDWQIVNNGDVFAKKVYTQTKDDSYGNKYTESTTLELRHIAK